MCPSKVHNVFTEEIFKVELNFNDIKRIPSFNKVKSCVWNICWKSIQRRHFPC